MKRYISGGKVIAFCPRCDKPVQLNKALFGGLHFCVSDCVLAGRHLAERVETRGHWWWRRDWAVCDVCRREERMQ